MIITPAWPAAKHVKAYTTTRKIWGERAADQDKSQGFYTANSTQNKNLIELLNLPADPIWIKQTHSTKIIEATPDCINQEADATFSHQKNHICVVLTADCLPILITNKEASFVAAIHAGWRGLLNGIIENTISILAQNNAELLVWLGPAIGPTKFEVGEEVYAAYTEKHVQAAKHFALHIPGKYFADLYALAIMRLHLLGITNIYGGEYCTYTQEDLFFSYRRDKGNTGRMASVIWLEK